MYDGFKVYSNHLVSKVHITNLLVGNSRHSLFIFFLMTNASFCSISDYLSISVELVWVSSL